MENREAIEILSRPLFMDGTPKEILDAHRMAISALEKQEQDRWIPITEKLPEPYKMVIVTDVETIDAYTSEYHGGGYWGTDTGDAKNRIIAWKPFPEPYTEEEA